MAASSTPGAGIEGLTRVVGLMSGTSLDGIDVAWIVTDGEARVETGPSLTIPYGEAFRARLRGILGSTRPSAEIADVEHDLTELHGQAVETLLARHGLPRPDLVGFHGHTIFHDPKPAGGGSGRTWQIGDGAGLARRLGVPVVFDFRSADVAAGGEGAPLAPVYHRALAHGMARPLAILNLGGVGNVTWLGRGTDEILAFDTGPGNALLDDWMLARTGQAMDQDGAIAATGRVDEAWVARFLAHPHFARPAPKSLDRDAFRAFPPVHLSTEDGAATLVAMTATAVAAGASLCPEPPLRWLVTGGGRRNATILAALRHCLGVPVEPVEAVGWDGDALEAQAFAYMAVRSRRGLAISFPGTTGVASAITGGVSAG